MVKLRYSFVNNGIQVSASQCNLKSQRFEFLKRGYELIEEFILKLLKEQQDICNTINRRTEFRVLSTDFIEKFNAEPEKKFSTLKLFYNISNLHFNNICKEIIY